MIKTGIGRTHSCHIQTVPAYIMPGDNLGTVPIFEEDLIELKMSLDADGYLEISEGIGLCFKIFEDRIDRYCTFWENIIKAS